MDDTDQISVEGIWAAIITIKTAVSLFVQIQLLSMSAGPSVSATEVYGPPPHEMYATP